MEIKLNQQGKEKKINKILNKLSDTLVDIDYDCDPRVYSYFLNCLSLSRTALYNKDRLGCIKQLRDIIRMINLSIDSKTNTNPYTIKILREMEQQTNDAILEIGKIWEYSEKSVILTLIKKIWKKRHF